jgi:hypothetical protein
MEGVGMQLRRRDGSHRVWSGYYLNWVFVLRIGVVIVVVVVTNVRIVVEKDEMANGARSDASCLHRIYYRWVQRYRYRFLCLVLRRIGRVIRRQILRHCDLVLSCGNWVLHGGVQGCARRRETVSGLLRSLGGSYFGVCCCCCSVCLCLSKTCVLMPATWRSESCDVLLENSKENCDALMVRA